MHPDFITAIQIGTVQGLFESNFDSYSKIKSFLIEKTPESLFSNVNDETTSSDAETLFQHLAFLVWFARPVYSGAYMIKFNSTTWAGVLKAYKKLGNYRLSSHMHQFRSGLFGGNYRHGRSAVGLLDWHKLGFIKGFNEVLLHIDESKQYLYLKLEGEQALSAGHLASFIRSRDTVVALFGSPAVKNPVIDRIVNTEETEAWISKGRKEVVGKNFKSLCKHLKIPKERMTVSYVIQKIYWLRGNLHLRNETDGFNEPVDTTFTARPLLHSNVRDLAGMVTDRFSTSNVSKMGIMRRAFTLHLREQGANFGKVELERLAEKVKRDNQPFPSGDIGNAFDMLVALHNWVHKAHKEILYVLKRAEEDIDALGNFAGDRIALPLSLPLLVDDDRWGVEVRITEKQIKSANYDFITHGVQAPEAAIADA